MPSDRAIFSLNLVLNTVGKGGQLLGPLHERIVDHWESETYTWPSFFSARIGDAKSRHRTSDHPARILKEEDRVRPKLVPVHRIDGKALQRSKLAQFATDPSLVQRPQLQWPQASFGDQPWEQGKYQAAFFSQTGRSA